jgi:hypothetical protein
VDQNGDTLSNDNSPKGGLIGPKSVAFWTVVAGIAAVITLIVTISGGGGGSGPRTGTSADSGSGSGSGSTGSETGTSSGSEGSSTGTSTGGGTGGTSTGTPIPRELFGEWQGSGNQYANDSYTMQIDMTLAPDGGYLLIQGGARDQGIYAVDGPLIQFQSNMGAQYVWRWTFANYGVRRVLKIQNEGGGIFTLQKA